MPPAAQPGPGPGRGRPPVGPAAVTVEFIGGPADGMIRDVPSLTGPAGPTGVPPLYQHLAIPAPDKPPAEYREGDGPVPTYDACYCRSPSLNDEGPLWWYVYCPSGEHPAGSDRPPGAER